MSKESREKAILPESNIFTSNVLVVAFRTPAGYLVHEVPPDDPYSPKKMDLVSGIVPDDTFYNPIALADHGQLLLEEIGINRVRPSEIPFGTSRKIAKYEVRTEDADETITEARDTRRVFLQASTNNYLVAPYGYRWLQREEIGMCEWRHGSIKRAMEILHNPLDAKQFIHLTHPPGDAQLEAYAIANPWDWHAEVQRRQHT